MIGEARSAVRNIGFLIVQRSFLVFGNLLFAVSVPRLMGPGNYGQFTLLLSLFVWFVMVGDLGFTQVIGRSVPQLIFGGDRSNLQKLFNNLLSISSVAGLLLSCLYLLLTTLWLTDLDRVLLAAMAAGVFLHGLSHPFFTLFMGLNKAARWGMEEILARWVSIFFIFVGFYSWGLRGACIGLLTTEIAVLIVALYWGRSYLSASKMRLDLGYMTPFLRFGLMFFIIGVLQTTFQRSGEVMVRLFHPDYTQVGYFGLAYSVYLTFYVAIPQVTTSFAPLLTTLQAKGDSETVQQWIEHLLKWMGVGAMGIIFGVLLLGNELLPLVLGAAYSPVSTNLSVLVATLPAEALGSVCTLLTIAYDRPRIALAAMILRLILLWGLGLPLVWAIGGLGASWAIFAASAIHAGYFVWRMQKVIPFPLRKWGLAVGLGGLFLPLLWFRSSWEVNLILAGFFVAGYSACLYFGRIITYAEIRALRNTFRPAEPSTEAI